MGIVSSITAGVTAVNKGIQALIIGSIVVITSGILILSLYCILKMSRALSKKLIKVDEGLGKKAQREGIETAVDAGYMNQGVGAEWSQPAGVLQGPIMSLQTSNQVSYQPMGPLACVGYINPEIAGPTTVPYLAAGSQICQPTSYQWDGNPQNVPNLEQPYGPIAFTYDMRYMNQKHDDIDSRGKPTSGADLPRDNERQCGSQHSSASVGFSDEN